MLKSKLALYVCQEQIHTEVVWSLFNEPYTIDLLIWWKKPGYMQNFFPTKPFEMMLGCHIAIPVSVLINVLCGSLIFLFDIPRLQVTPGIVWLALFWPKAYGTQVSSKLGLLKNIQVIIHISSLNFLTWLLVGWRICSQPNRSQVWKTYLTNTGIKLEISKQPMSPCSSAITVNLKKHTRNDIQWWFGYL